MNIHYVPGPNTWLPELHAGHCPSAPLTHLPTGNRSERTPSMAAFSGVGAAPVGASFSMRAIIGPLVAIIIGVFMVVLDSTAMNVALPSLVGSLHDPLSALQWTITGYVLAQAA